MLEGQLGRGVPEDDISTGIAIQQHGTERARRCRLGDWGHSAARERVQTLFVPRFAKDVACSAAPRNTAGARVKQAPAMGKSV
jgi:hypothetical protein